MGKVVLLGAGPGDVGLLTLKGKAYIEKADCIVYDRLIGSDILSFARPDCDMVYAGKENRHHVMTQDEINEELYQKALAYPLVVRVKGGDPYVFGRGGEEALYLRERGIACEVVPGVSSFIAALTDAGIPITHRAVARGFQVMTAHAKGNEPLDIPYAELLNPEKTCVFMMGLSNLREIAEQLMAAGRAPSTPAAVISDGTRNNQRKCVGTLADIADKTAEAGLGSPAVIVVGEVVPLQQELSFFENRPLFGKSYFVPWTQGIRFSFADGLRQTGESELVTMLKEAGAQVLAPKVGAIEALPCDADAAGADWLIFTSKNGVYACLWNQARQGKDLRALGSAKIAAVGEKTAAVLKSFGLTADLIPAVQTGEALGEALVQIAPGEKALWFCAEKIGRSLEEKLSAAMSLEKRICYRNAPVECALSDQERAKIAACAGVYTSASAAERGCAAVGFLPGTSYSIGPECTGKLKALGAAEIVQAEESSFAGLCRCMERG